MKAKDLIKKRIKSDIKDAKEEKKYDKQLFKEDVDGVLESIERHFMTTRFDKPVNQKGFYSFHFHFNDCPFRFKEGYCNKISVALLKLDYLVKFTPKKRIVRNYGAPFCNPINKWNAFRKYMGWKYEYYDDYILVEVKMPFTNIPLDNSI